MINKKISIITVCYNAEKTIEDCIVSVIRQTEFKNIEYIVIDGLSTDNTVNIVNKYKDNISFFVSEKDNGIYNAMNKGLELASGEYVAFLNADDFYRSCNSISNIISIINETKNSYDVICADTVLVSDVNGEKQGYKKANPIKLSNYMSISHPSTFIKRKIHDYFDESYLIAADYHHLLKLKKAGYSFFTKNQIITVMRLGGVSDKYRRLSVTESMRVRRELLPMWQFLIYNYRDLFKEVIKKLIRV